MNDKFVLNYENLIMFLEKQFSEKDIDCELLNLKYDDYCTFETQIHSNNIFFSRYIQKLINNNKYNPDIIKDVYDLQENSFFYLEEIDSSFIDYLLLNPTNKSNLFDVEITEIHDNYLMKNYAK